MKIKLIAFLLFISVFDTSANQKISKSNYEQKEIKKRKKNGSYKKKNHFFKRVGFEKIQCNLDTLAKWLFVKWYGRGGENFALDFEVFEEY